MPTNAVALDHNHPYCGCRLCKPSGFIDVTGPVELNPSTIEMDIPETYPTITEENVTYIGNLKKPDKRIIVWEIKRTILEPMPDILPDDISKENMINNLKKVIDKDAWYKRNFDLILKKISTTIL